MSEVIDIKPKEEDKLVVLPQKDLESIYTFVLSLPAKDVLHILKHFEKVRLAEEK